MDKKVYEFIRDKTGDPIVEWKTCKVSGKPFPIFQSDISFYDKISPVLGGKKYPMPLPTLCPEERERRRFARRNERNLYPRKCDATGKPIISIYSQDKNYKVFEQKVWRSDAWDPLDYGQNFDFTQPFFQQFDTLLHQVPLLALYNTDVVNSEYNNHFGNAKNCYLNFGSRECEETLFTDRTRNAKYCADCSATNRVEYCYQCISCNNCYKVQRSTRSDDCTNAMFLLNCKNCNYCYGCYNLVGKQFCIFNQQYSKEEYLRIVGEKDLGSYTFVQSELQYFMNFCKDASNKTVNAINVVDSFGNNISDCKNCYCCHDVSGGEDCKYIMNGEPILKTNYDGIGVGINSELGYEIIDSGVDSMKNCFAFVFRVCNDTYYTYNCHYCSHLFGCIGLRNKEYCILNKQYSKEEYERLVPQIIAYMTQTGEWGEFFPISISPFGYNETIAQDNHPLTRDEAIARGYKWQDMMHHINIPTDAPRISAQELPDHIQDVPDDIIQKIILCEKTGDPFRIVRQELDFYRKQGIPLPHKHPNVRYQERIKGSNERKLYYRVCEKCGENMLSVYDEHSSGKIYCETCYNKELY